MNEHLQYVRDIISAVLPAHASLSITDTSVTVSCRADVLDVAQAVYAVTQVELSAPPTFVLCGDKFSVSAALD